MRKKNHERLKYVSISMLGEIKRNDFLEYRIEVKFKGRKERQTKQDKGKKWRHLEDKV